MIRRFAVSAFALAPAAIAGWSLQAPRDVVFHQGTGAISGVIVSADEGKPIPRAIVTLGGGLAASFTIIAGANGEFMFDQLDAAQYTLSAAKPAFIAMAYGQVQPGRGSGVPLALEEGERRADLRLALPKAGAVAGRVIDESGRPMSGANVVLQQRRVVDGESRLVNCRSQTKTDADGLYRITGLLPGEYVVSAVPPGDFLFIGDGPISSYGEETRRVTDEEVRWALREMDAAASGRGAIGPPAAEPPRGPTVSYGRSYFPGTEDSSRATGLPVKLGEERGGVDFTMHRQPTAIIQGLAVEADGQPAANASFTFSDGSSWTGSRLGGDGSFVRRNLLPGRYTVTVRGRGAPSRGSRIVDLNGVDVRDLVVTLGPAASVSGRVVFEPVDATASDPAGVQMSVSLRPPVGTTPVRVAADGSFTFPVVDPGRYRLTASITAAGRGAWTVKSITTGGHDAADVPFDVGTGQAITDVVVTFTTRSTSLSGTLLTADGAPAAGYYVVVFATERAFWVPGSRRLPTPARASTDGRFAFTGLPPGTYGLAALTTVDESDLADPAFLAALEASAITVTLADGEKKTQDLKFARR